GGLGFSIGGGVVLDTFGLSLSLRQLPGRPATQDAGFFFACSPVSFPHGSCAHRCGYASRLSAVTVGSAACASCVFAWLCLGNWCWFAPHLILLPRRFPPGFQWDFRGPRAGSWRCSATACGWTGRMATCLGDGAGQSALRGLDTRAGCWVRGIRWAPARLAAKVAVIASRVRQPLVGRGVSISEECRCVRTWCVSHAGVPGDARTQEKTGKKKTADTGSAVLNNG